MEDNSAAQVPLLENQVHKKGSVFVSSVKWVLQVLMMVVFASWVVFIFVYPTDFGNGLFGKWVSATDGTLFGITGSIFLLVSGPVLVIALLGALHLVISGDEEVSRQKSSKFPRVRLWTFPVLVDGPFGVISAAELIGILLFVAYIVSAMYSYTLQNLALISELHLSDETSIWMLELTGLRLGMMGLFCLAFLFLPVARGSVLLRLIDVPFEHAARYHVWLGHLTMLLFTLHGLFYVIGWALQGTLLKEILEWRSIGVANLAGVISLLAGLLMWVTSMPGLRTWNFELFFYTHQLYVIFVLFLAFHVGDFIFSIAAGPIFLFMMDRFLRFCQSRKKVGVVSAKTLPCGTVELVLSKPASLRYNALSFVFLQLRELSWLQWHPFSVSSSPLDGKHHLSVLIKVLGGWTDKLTRKLNNNSEEASAVDSPSETFPGITVSVEGPYGHEVPYHLMYEHLILVAGGIGISPFLAILSDILHLLNEGRPCLPRNVMVIWAIKKSDELPLLSTIDMEKICPSFSAKLNLDIQIFVTRETESSVEEGRANEVSSSPAYPTRTKGHGMSVLVGTGHNVWSGLYILSSTLGLVVLLYLLDTFYINPLGITTWWYKGLLFIGCMVASIVVFGGVVIGFWHLWEKKSLARDEYDDERSEIDEADSNEDMTNTDLDRKIRSGSTMIHYGSRPDFTDILSSVTKRWGHVDIGVIVCGPPSLQASVARSIRSQNLGRDSTSDPVFHFNSHSFDL